MLFKVFVVIFFYIPRRPMKHKTALTAVMDSGLALRTATFQFTVFTQITRMKFIFFLSVQGWFIRQQRLADEQLRVGGLQTTC